MFVQAGFHAFRRFHPAAYRFLMIPAHYFRQIAPDTQLGAVRLPVFQLRHGLVEIPVITWRRQSAFNHPAQMPCDGGMRFSIGNE
ncbi:hypothetical protein [Dickeya dianthicola]|uniref:hypothetical protein n=1 Tax=Dickeya dianthicola TaxID=204039 RepID=UPI003016ADDF